MIARPRADGPYLFKPGNLSIRALQDFLERGPKAPPPRRGPPPPRAQKTKQGENKAKRGGVKKIKIM